MTSVNMSKKGFVPLNQDEIKRLKSFLSELETPTTVTTSLAYLGMFPFPLSLGKSQFSVGFNASDKPYNQYWILDSGATDHMTPLPTQFSTYSPCLNNKKISTADGTLLTVAGQGDIQISPSIILRNVLHIPKLSTSLISIQKLTKNLSCNAIFYDNACVFQDKHSGRTIGNAREWNGLYYLDNQNLPPNPLNNSNSLFSESIKTNRDKVFLYHCRLGHPSFRVMKQIFPSFFKNLDVESLCCEVCELAKHKRASFPVSNKVSTSPFYLIHTDVWGPSNVPNISGARCDNVETEIDPKNVETRGDNVETEIDSEKDENVGVDVRYGKNLVYTRKKNIIPESTHIHESNPTLHEETFLDPSTSSDSISEFSPVQVPESSSTLQELNPIKHKKPKSREVTPIHSKDSHLPIAHRKETRTCTNKPLYPLSNYLCFEQLSTTHKAFLTSLNTTTIPTSLSEALSDKKWKQAMDLEMEALDKNNTWELVSLPNGKKPVGCKWVYTVKYKADGSIERYKARLVAKGFTQTYGIDYSETFAPVAKMNTVRVILSLAANYNWNLQQFDVKNAFLHGELEEEIYMDVPPGYREDIAANTVCKLKKALYGLKQSPRAWFGRFTKVMVGLGFKQSQGDHTLFVKHSKSGGVTVLLVYVDDVTPRTNYP
ncbi:unnamed protein product [Trifolium pratense]|uniref:Uncharacterized protein n=1 Tax=Trifolium pratense TaxID=57577 RepID=A0ACB0I6K6_TRIPR|nr:unnamed protein product [Trifolium pratense]